MTVTVHDPDARPEPCTKRGHVPGCPGRAGGDHERARRHLMPVWLAGPDGIGHASRRNAARAFCGRPAVVERYAYTAERRCEDCRRVAERGAGA